MKGREISDEALEEVEVALRKGNNWVAYNKSLYFIDKNDILFFESQDSADRFAGNFRKSFNLIHISSVRQLFLKIPYTKEPFQNGLQNNLKTNFMNEENLKYLKDNIKYMGFGEKLNDQLENNLKIGNENFQLAFKAVVNNKPFEATLHFRKSASTDMYFFNSFNASLQKSNGEKVDQTFYLNKGKGITAKEAYNLLDGRSVHKQLTPKEGEPYHAWLQIDFENKDKNNNFKVNQFHENYGYDLKAAVSKYAVAELNSPEKEKDLMQSLQKGNIQSITIEKDGSSQKMFIEANPQFKSVTLYDGQMKRVQKENLEQYKSVSQGENKEIKQDVKQDQKQDVKKDIKQNMGEQINGSKKKTSRKKGMSV